MSGIMIYVVIVACFIIYYRFLSGKSIDELKRMWDRYWWGPAAVILVIAVILSTLSFFRALPA